MGNRRRQKIAQFWKMQLRVVLEMTQNASTVIEQRKSLPIQKSQALKNRRREIVTNNLKLDKLPIIL